MQWAQVHAGGTCTPARLAGPARIRSRRVKRRRQRTGHRSPMEHESPMTASPYCRDDHARRMCGVAYAVRAAASLLPGAFRELPSHSCLYAATVAAAAPHAQGGGEGGAGRSGRITAVGTWVYAVGMAHGNSPGGAGGAVVVGSGAAAIAAPAAHAKGGGEDCASCSGRAGGGCRGGGGGEGGGVVWRVLGGAGEPPLPAPVGRNRVVVR